MNPPCKDCPKRHPACHDTCEPYQAFKTEREAYLAAKLLERSATVVHTRTVHEQRTIQRNFRRQSAWRK